MRVSIWQQFSSNHSAIFTVVGKFDSVERAKEIEALFTGILRNIGLAVDHSTIPPVPSPYEKELAEKYGIEWPHGIDWVYFDHRDNNQFDYNYIHRFEDYVFVDWDTVSTWQGPSPLKHLMAKLTDEVHVYCYMAGEEDKIILTELKCKTPDSQTASDICRDSITHFVDERDRDLIRAPWEEHVEPPYFDLECPVAGTLGGKVEHHSESIHFVEIPFYNTHHGLPALIAYLMDKGCTEIEYSLSTVPYASRPEYI